MALTPGTRFGSHEIAEPIGAGGMGEVYRARDQTLERDVAIKVLPPSFALDENRVARFEQEAKTLASPNHVNIAHIYGLERSDGTTGLAMELVEGPTLAERIEQGPIPPEEALGIALQIADALEAAHSRGIVHRDLKPANIKLATDGTVKVLDFGIAKALDTRTISGPQALFAIEIERCRGCGGRLEVIASIEDPALIERILARVRRRSEEDLPLPLGARGPPPWLL